MTYPIKPFWSYYGGKFKVAPRYPEPKYDTIIEPFAGAAGYSTRYYYKQIILVEKYPVIAEMWRFLISSNRDNILSIPLVENIDDLPPNTPVGAKYLVGFSLNDATVSPANTLSSGRKKLALMGRKFQGWNKAKRLRIANQVELINHWIIIEGDYSVIGSYSDKATWFIDPPYNNKAGSLYKHSKIDYDELSFYVKTRIGQTIVCENYGANWLPFKPLLTTKQSGGSFNGIGGKQEMIYHIHNETGLSYSEYYTC